MNNINSLHIVGYLIKKQELKNHLWICLLFFFCIRKSRLKFRNFSSMKIQKVIHSGNELDTEKGEPRIFPITEVVYDFSLARVMHSHKNYYMRKHCKMNLLLNFCPLILKLGSIFVHFGGIFAPSPHQCLTLLDAHWYSLILYKDLALVLGCTQTSMTHCDPKSFLTFGNLSHTSYIMQWHSYIFKCGLSLFFRPICSITL